MRPVSDAFLAALRGSHKMVVQAFAVDPGQSGVNPAGTELNIVGGDVVHDGTADIRGTLDMVTTPDMWPTSATSPLAPYGQEIFVRRGVEFGDRTREWVSLGYFRVDEPEQEIVPGGEVTVTGSDRMANVVDGRLTSPRQYPLGTTVQDVYDDLVSEVYPGAVLDFDFDATAVVLNRSHVVEEKRYEFLRDLAASMAKDFYVDHEGRFTVRDRPDPADPVWTVNGGARGVLVKMGRSLTRAGVYNGVVATGEGADDVAPVSALAYDADPNSPTYWGGPFGRVPRFYSSPFITTTTQARSAAEKILTDGLGLPFAVDFSAVPNPALEPNDPVRIDSPAYGGVHVIQSVTVPLTADAAIAATTKDKTAINIDVTALAGDA